MREGERVSEKEGERVRGIGGTIWSPGKEKERVRERERG